MVNTGFSAESVLKHYQELVFRMEMKTNWLIGIATVIMVLLITNFQKITEHELSSIGALIIICGCGVAIFNFMMVLVPGIKRNIHNSALKEINVFEYRNIKRNFSKNEFINYLERLHKNQGELDKMYSNAIYQLCSMRLPRISKGLRVGGWSLISSLLIGTLLVLVGFFI